MFGMVPFERHEDNFFDVFDNFERKFFGNSSANLPAFRTDIKDADDKFVLEAELPGFDKEDIVNIAKKIGTFETSILPYEDCCTVFVPQHPATRPKVAEVRASEAAVDFSGMIEKAIAETETMDIN